VIVLLTDFGCSEYVGVIKAVIHGLAPAATVVDLTHTISPQSVIEASWVLKRNYRYFPKGSTFCAVVDPGVGTARQAVAVKTTGYFFVAPDNGLVWEAVRRQRIECTRQLPVPPGASRTFHARDVFARAAAMCELGRFDRLGRPVRHLRKLAHYKRGRTGIVVRIDHFGNVVTNLRKLAKRRYAVRASGAERTLPYFSTYAAAPDGELFLIEGSNGTLEVSLKNGNAAAELAVQPGEKITIR